MRLQGGHHGSRPLGLSDRHQLAAAHMSSERPGLSAALAAATVVVAATRPDPACVPARRPGRSVRRLVTILRREAAAGVSAALLHFADACCAPGISHALEPAHLSVWVSHRD